MWTPNRRNAGKTFYSESATAVSPTDHTLVGAKGPKNVWLFELSRLLEAVKFL